MNAWQLVSVSLLAGASVLWFWFTTRYRIAGGALHLYSGPFHSTIPLRRIRAVITNRQGQGMSYALSLRSLQIDVAGSSIGYRVSPQDPTAFVAALAERCPQLSYSGADLVAR